MTYRYLQARIKKSGPPYMLMYLSLYRRSFNVNIRLDEVSGTGRGTSPGMLPRAEWTLSRCIVYSARGYYLGIIWVHETMNTAAG